MRVNIGPYPEDESEREVEIHVDDFDTWSLDATIALILVPCLKQLKETTHGAPIVENDDVPEELRAPRDYDPFGDDTDDNFFKRWDWVLDEMIFAFENIANDDWILDRENRDDIDKRIDNGTRLFGKYLRACWD